MNYKDFVFSENGMKIIGFIVTIIVAYITAKLTSKNTKKSLTTQYFKEKGVDIQERVLHFWVNLFMNSFNISRSYKQAYKIEKELKVSDLDALLIVQEDSYSYCSSKTISAIKDYMQFNYKANRNKKEPKNRIYKLLKNKINTFSMLILISRIINRMKYDFTGENVDELDIIKIKINDLNFYSISLSRMILWYYNLKEYFFKIFCFLILLVLIILLVLYI